MTEKQNMAHWAFMCEDCYKLHGIGLGLGKGQKINYKELK